MTTTTAATTNKLHVIRNPRLLDNQPWLVVCDHCPRSGSDGHNGFPLTIAGLFSEGGRVLGWAATWELAQYHADRHARLHEERRCPTCAHVPMERLEEVIQ